MNPTEGRQEVERDHFDRLADEQGDIWWGSATTAGLVRLQRRARLLAEKLETYADPVVMELGCGTGAFTQCILSEIPLLHIEGIDVSPKCIEVAEARLEEYANAHFRIGDATSLDRSDDSIDAVVGNAVLHHLPLEKSVVESFRVLKPGGLFQFSEPNMMNPEILLEKNIRFIGKLTQNTPDETAFFRWPLQRMLQEAGFTEVDVCPFDFLHPLVPGVLIRPTVLLGMAFEHLPLIREIAGSLLIRAKKPRQG